MIIVKTIVIALFTIISFVCIQNDHQRLLLINQSQVLTNPIRTSNSLKYCQNSKSNLITNSDRSMNNIFYTNLNAYFSSQNNKIPAAILNNDMNTVTNEIQKLSFLSIALYSSAFIVGTIIIFFLFVIACCCWLFPNNCPPKRCQKKADLLYSQKQLIIPSVCSVFSFIMIFGLSITGIIYTFSLNNSIQTAECGFSIILDDIINGNVSNDQTSYLLGLNQLGYFTNNTILTINNNLSAVNLKNITTSYNQSLNNLVNDLTFLPNSSTPNGFFNLTYTLPTPMSSTPVLSSFGNALGNISTPSSLTGSIYSTLILINNTINDLLQTISNSQVTIQNNLGLILNQVNQYNQYAKNMNQNLMTILKNVDNYKPYVMYVGESLFGFLMCVSFIGIIAIMLLFFCKKYQPKKFIYCSCMLLWFGSLFAFILSCALVFLVPFMFLECKAANQAFTSNLGFTSFSSSIGISTSDASILSTCLNSDGDFLSNTINLTNIQSSINNNLNNIQINIDSINNQNLNFSNILTNTTNTIYNYNRGYINDIIFDSNSRVWFQNVSTRKQYTPICSSDPIYNADSFVPSTSSYSIAQIPCGTSTLAVNCTTINTCSTGCIDMNNIMWNEINVTTYSNDITSVFSGSCGSIISDEFTSVYNNWFIPRTDKNIGIQSIYNKFTAINNSIVSDGNILINNLNSVNNQLNTILNNVNTQINYMFNPTNGIIIGTNCTVVGQDISFAKDSICISVFNNVYILLIITGIISYVSLCGIFCFICSGFRHYKQGKKYEQNIINQVKLQKKSVPEKSYTEGEDQQ